MTPTLTPEAVIFLASLEGLCLEAYKDSLGIWTWGLGVTNSSGHEVYPRYKDAPQSLDDCLRVAIWLLREKYLPSIGRAFNRELSPNELAAALSFHWNTGAIEKTQWPKLPKNEAETFLRTHYLNGGLLQSRRDIEADLFFHGKYPSDLRCPIYPVSRPSYHPDIRKGNRIDISQNVRQLLV